MEDMIVLNALSKKVAMEVNRVPLSVYKAKEVKGES